MEKIRIITDSGSDLLAPHPQNLTVLPMSIRFGDEEYRDGVNLDHKTFFKKLTSCAELPTTSLVPPGEFEAAYLDAKAAGETVIAITLSSKLSGTWQSAVLGAQDHEHVRVVDSMNATLGEQLLVKYALSLAEKGMNADEIVAELERVKSSVRLFGITDTLEYLHRGGRISKTVAVLGGALSIKPILKLAEGKVTMAGKARGLKSANRFMMEEVKKAGLDLSKPFVLGYTGSSARMEQFIQDCGELWNGWEGTLPIASVGATIGTHLGPDATVIAFFGNPEM